MHRGEEVPQATGYTFTNSLTARAQLLTFRTFLNVCSIHRPSSSNCTAGLTASTADSLEKLSNLTSTFYFSGQTVTRPELVFIMVELSTLLAHPAPLRDKLCANYESSAFLHVETFERISNFPSPTIAAMLLVPRQLTPSHC